MTDVPPLAIPCRACKAAVRTPCNSYGIEGCGDYCPTRVSDARAAAAVLAEIAARPSVQKRKR